MASQGPLYPGTTASLANAGSSEDANAWTSPGNVAADDGSEAAITAATYDSPDISELLVASNFGFTIPSGATINGIVVEIERRDSAGAASDNRVQLAKGTTFASLVGSNKADTALDWPGTATVKSYGANNDLWGTTWTDSEINASSFAVFLSVQADAANTDIHVDYVRVTVHYTAAAITGTATVTVDEAALAGTGTHAEAVTGTGAPSIDEATLSASGAEIFTGTAAVAVDEAVLAAAGSEGMTGTGAVSVDEAVLDGTGTHTESGVSGTGAVAVDEAVLAASGAEAMSGAATVTLDDPAVAAVGSELFSGVVALILDEPVLAAIGLVIVPVTGTGAISVDEAVLVAVAEVPIPIAGNPLELTRLWVSRRRSGLRHVR